MPHRLPFFLSVQGGFVSFSPSRVSAKYASRFCEIHAAFLLNSPRVSARLTPRFCYVWYNDDIANVVNDMERYMENHFLQRNMKNALFSALSDMPVTILQGARQVGKSTLISMMADEIDSRQLTLDDPDLLLAAQNDPVEFVNQYKDGTLVIDEVQFCPKLLSAIKLSVDRDRRPGRFLLTGSANLLHVSGANESLAGRAETLFLAPFSMDEIEGRKADFITALLSGDISDVLRVVKPLTRAEYVDHVVSGGFPAAYRRQGNRRGAYFENYIASVLDHDASILSNLSQLDKLSSLFKILSANTSGIFVQANVSRQVGIPETSMNGYIKLLKDLNLISALPAWGRNIAKRAVSKPKISLLDTGIAAHLNGVQREYLADITGGEAFGALLETFVVNELQKQRTWSGTRYGLFHYHDREKREVDVVAELPNGKVIAFEIKAARTISRNDFKGMNYIKELIGDRFYCGVVLYTGAETQQYGDRVFSAPICTIWK